LPLKGPNLGCSCPQQTEVALLDSLKTEGSDTNGP